MATANAFQEQSTVPATGLRAVSIWLYSIAAMVFAMVILGGLTRLTGSGLSMVEWQPIAGIMPPLNDADWQTLFDKYRQFPEFQKVNFWMSVDDFKSIFWLEYLHRIFGRIIGIAFFVPFIWFLVRRQIPKHLVSRMVGLFILGSLQGLLGWYMVRSGLVDRPDVSHYRLAAHLGLAVAIYCLLIWTAMSVGRTRTRPTALRRHSATVGIWAFCTLIAGAFVAGMDAGHIYPTFPLMDGALLPPEALSLSPAWVNLTENPAMVQFIHRWMAIGLVIISCALWWRVRSVAPEGNARRAADLLAIAVAVQAGLGIATLLTGVPIVLGALHQAGALVVLTAAIWLMFEVSHGGTVRNRVPA